MEKENKQLKREINKIQAQILKKEDQIDKINARYENLSVTSETRIAKLKETITNLKETNGELVAKLSNNRLAHREQKNGLSEQTIARKERHEAKVERLNNQISELSAEIIALKERQAEIMGNANEHMTVDVKIFDRKEIVKLMTMETMMEQIKNPEYKKLRLTQKDNVKYLEVFGGIDSPEDVFVGKEFLFNPSGNKIEKMTYVSSAITSNFINKAIAEAPSQEDAVLCAKLAADFKAKLIAEKAVSREANGENGYVTQTTYVTFNQKYKRFIFMTIYN